MRDVQSWNALATKEMEKFGYTAEEVAKNLETLQMPEFKTIKDDISELNKRIEELKTNSEETSSKLADTEKALEKYGIATTRTGRLVQSAAKMVKSALASLGIMALIMGAIAGLQQLGK